MKAATVNPMCAAAATDGEGKAKRILDFLKENLPYWTMTRADMARMQREAAREYQEEHADD